MLRREIETRARVLVREVPLPADRAASLGRRVRATERVRNLASVLVKDLIDEAAIEEDEAWQECARIAGFSSLEDADKQGFVLVYRFGVIEIRKRNVPEWDAEIQQDKN